MANNIKFDVDLNVKKEGLNALKQSLQEIQKITTSEFANMNKNLSFNEARKQLSEVKRAASEVEAALKKAFNADLGTTNITKLNQELKGLDLNNVYSQFSKMGAAGNAAFRGLTTQIVSTNMQLKETNHVLDQMAATMANTVRWGITSSVMNSFTGAVQQAYGYVKNLDSSLNEIRIVTGKSADEMARFAETANKAAQGLGAGTTDYTRAALIYYQQGLGDAEAQARAETTLKAANITGQSAQSVSEQLTAVWNGYKVSADEAEAYVDKLAAVAASTASDLEELSTGMSRVASAAANMGVDVDQLNAQLATIISVTRQAPESVGTALRSIYARMSQLKADGTDEFGVTLGNYTEQMRTMGIEVLDQEGNLREMGDVIEEVAGKWDGWTQAQRNAAAQVMAGTRQYNNLVALFDNWDMYTEALETSQNALGTLQQQQDIYMESTAAHLQQVRTAFEGVADSLLDGDTINVFADALTFVFDRLEGFIDTVGGGGELLFGIFSSLAQVFSKQIASGLMSFVNNIKVADENAAALQAHLQNIDFVKDSEAYQKDKGVEYITDMADEITRYYSVMSEGEMNAANSLAEQAADAKVLEMQWEENKQKALEYAKTLARTNTANENGRNGNGRGNAYSEKDLRPDSGGFYGNIKQDLTEVNTALENTEKNINKVSGAFTKWDAADEVRKLNTQFKPLTQSIEDTYTVMQRLELRPELVPAVQKFNKILEDVGITANMTGEQIQKALIEAFQNGNLDRGSISRLLSQMRQIGTVGQEQMGVLQYVLNMTDEEIKKFATDSEAARAIFENFINEQKLKNTINGITQLVGVAGQLGFVFNTVDGIIKTLTNNELSFTEKLGNTITTVSFLIPSLIQMGKSLKTAGAAFGLLTIEKIKEGAATTASTAAELAHVGALKLVKTSSGEAMIATKFLNREIMLSPYVAAAAAAIALVTALFAVADAANKASQATIEANNKIIDEENKKQEEIDANQELWDSLDELDKKYSDGSISRLELKDSIETLIEQYGLEGEAADSLRESYDNLTESIRNSRIERAQAGIDSATKEKEAADKALIATANGGLWDNHMNILGQYTMGLNTSAEWGGAGRSDSFYDEPASLLKALQEAGGNIMLDTTPSIRFDVDYDAESLVQLYDLLKDIYDEAGKLSDEEKDESEVYKNLGEWLNNFAEPVEKYKAAVADVKNYTTELTGLTAEQAGQITFDEDNIKNVNDYLVQRVELIKQIKENNEDIKDDEEATKLANDYLLNYHKNLYNQYNEIANFLEDFKEKTGRYSNQILDLINQLDENQLNTFLAIDPSTFQTWEDVGFVLQRIAEMDFSNVEKLSSALSVDDIKAKQQEAAENYNLYNDVGTSVEKGKTITSKVYEQLEPALQEYFTMAANGQYKMTEDAKEFYQAVNSFKIEGFTDLLDGLEERFADLYTLRASNFDYNQLSQEAIAPGGFAAREPIDYDLVNQQLQYLDAVTDSNSELGVSIDLWKQQAEYHRLTVDEVKAIAEAVGQVGDQTKTAGEEALALTELYNNALDQIREAMDPLDEDVDTDTFESLTEILLEDEKALKKVTHALDRDLKDAAEEVAEAVLRFDNAIVDCTEHYDDWMKALQSDALGDHAEVLSDIADMYGDLLDIDASSLSPDFVSDTSNLELAKQAINGVESAYDELQAKATEDIIINCVLDENQGDVRTKLAELKAQIDSFQGNDIELNAFLHTDQFKAACQDIVDAAGVSAVTAHDLLASGLGVDVTCTEHTNDTEEVQEVRGFDAVLMPTDQKPFSAPALSDDGKSVTQMDGYYQAASLSYIPGPSIKVASKKQNKAFTTTVDSVNGTTTGGGYKFQQASHGGGSKGGSSGGGGGRKGGGGGKKGGSGKTYTPKKVDVNKQKSDRYHDINIELDRLARKYDKLADAEKKLTGKDLLNNLDKQLKNLQQQNKAIDQKLKLEREERNELKKDMKKQGFKFDDAGNITNYNKVLDAEYKKLEKLQKKYNKATTEEEQKKIDEQIKAQEKAIKEKEENAERYDEITFTEIPDLKEEQQKNKDTITETLITEFDYTLQVRLDFSEAVRDYNEFKEKVEKNYWEPKNASGENLFEDKNGNIAHARRLVADWESYFNDGAGGGLIQDETKNLGTLLQQWQDLKNTGSSSIFGDFEKDLEEHVNEGLESLMKHLEELVEIEEQLHETYIDMIEEAEEAFDEQADTYEYIDDMLEHDMDLMGLLYGDEAYEQMSKYYTQRKANNEQELDFMRKRTEYAKAMYESETDPETKQKWKEQWLDAQEELNDKFQEHLELIAEEYTNTVNSAFQKLNDKLTHGLGLGFLEDEWDLMEKRADQYLDAVNATYGIQQLQNKYQEAIDSTDDVHNQQMLNDIMQEELGALRERDHLSQYDLDRANKRYEIALKQMALEDAQQNKSKMRLRRDSQGNYSYQFVADEDEVSKLRDELDVLRNELYNLDVNKFNENLKTIYDLNKEFQEKTVELELDTQRQIEAVRNDASLSNEERAARETQLLEEKSEKECKLRELYEGLINDVVHDNLIIRENLTQSSAEVLQGIYDENEEAFKNMTGHNTTEFLNMDGTIKEDMMGELVPTWNSGLKTMADEILSEGGVRETYLQTFRELSGATAEYADSVSRAADLAGKDLTDLTKGYDANAEEIRTLVKNNDDLITRYKEEIDYVRQLITDLANLKNQYDAAAQAAKNMVDQAQEAKRAQAQSVLTPEPTPTPTPEPTPTPTADDTTPGFKTQKNVTGVLGDILDDSKKTVTGEKKSTDKTEKQYYGVAIAIWNGGYGWGDDPQRSDRLHLKGFNVDKMRTYLNKVNPAVKSGAWENKWYGINRSNLKNYAYSKFDTGGYTGEWGKDGKLAMLHEKELVLNKVDTKNILDAVNLVRQLNDSMNSRIAGMLGVVRGGSSSYTNSNAVEQTVHITAEFPGVRDSSEIERALNNLINSASQYAFRSTP